MRVGQKVVCVENFNPELNETCPVVGDILTIRDMFDCNAYGLMLRFKEIINKKYFYRDIGRLEETAFKSFKFRPVDETFGSEICESIEKEMKPETVQI